MPKYTYHDIKAVMQMRDPKTWEIESRIVYGETVEAEFHTDHAAEVWAAGCALKFGAQNVYFDRDWVPFSGLGDTVTYRKLVYDRPELVGDAESQPIGELLTTEEPVTPTYTPAPVVPAEMHWAGLAIEELNELCDRAEDAISQLRRNLFVDVGGLAMAFADAMKKIGRAAAEREANKRATTTR
jgi:hypothetical protein